MTKTAPAQKPILVIGAGISGLALAALLTQHGIPNIVFEASSNDRSQGYGITLREWSYKPLLSDLEDVSINDLETATATDRHIGGTGWIDLTLRDITTGKIIMAPEVAAAGTSDPAIFRVNRNALRIWLRTLGEKKMNVRYRHKLKSFQGEMGNVKVHFENGVEVEGSLIVAADGVHSTIRQQILPDIIPDIIPAVVYHGEFRLSHADFNTLVKPIMGNSNILAGVGDNLNTPITISNINDKTVDLDWSYSRAVCGDNDPLFRPARTQDEARQVPIDLLNELESANMVPPFSYILSTDHIQKNEVYNWLSRSVFIPRPGLNKAVGQGAVFIGDSAHGMPIFGGEGGNHALLDAVELARVLVGGRVPREEATIAGISCGELERSIHRYYDGAYKRCQDAVRRSTQRFQLLHRPIGQWRALAEQSKQPPAH